VDDLLTDFLAAVSFPPDYERVRKLFIPGGLLVRMGVPTTVEAFIDARHAAYAEGAMTEFEETELRGETMRFGKVAHRTSGYAKRGVLDGEAFSTRGVISTQFVLTDDGWRISSMAWDDEHEGLEVPEGLR